MSDDSLLERLTQFTPAGGKLDRDALLFAAGRASVRPSRGWRVSTAVLAASQLMTLALLFWPRDVLPMRVPDKEVAPIANTAPPPSPPPATRIPESDERSSSSALLQYLIDSDGKLPPPETFELSTIPDDGPRGLGMQWLNLLPHSQGNEL